jgi:hypothetical protein
MDRSTSSRKGSQIHEPTDCRKSTLTRCTDVCAPRSTFGLQVLTFPAEPGEAVIDRSVQGVDQDGGAIGGVFRAERGRQRGGSTYGEVVDGYALQDGAVTLTVLDR